MFDINKVTTVYSGRKGCACGCKGKYSYASAHADARPSYYCGDEGISDRSVKALVNRVEKMLHDPNSEVQGVMIDDDGGYFAVDLYHDRTYTIYFS